MTKAVPGARPQPKGPKEAKDSPRRLEAEVRERRAWEMRLGGASTADIIAADIGYTSRQGVHSGIEAYRQRVYQGDATDLTRWVDLHLARLEAMVAKMWGNLTREVVETTGTGDKMVTTTRTEVNTGVVDAIVRVLMREAKLLGLDAADQRAERQVEIDTALAERFLQAFQLGLDQPGITDEMRTAIEAAVLAALRAPVQVGAESRN